MKGIFLTMAVVACSFSIHAQIAEVSSIDPLLRGVESDMHNPVLSEDGSKLLFTSSNFTGLRMYDFNDDVTVKISDEERAGFNASFSNDSKTVYYVAQNRVNGLNMRSVKQYNVVTKKNIDVTPNGRLISKGGVSAKVDGKSYVISSQNEISVRTEGAKLCITCNGVEREYSPVAGSVCYLWASVSPDKTKVMFFAASKGIFIVDLNGNIISKLGNYESPVWYGNDCVVAMNAKHDGYQHTSSQIVMMRADGSEMQELTRPESMTMFPTASSKAGKIIYNTIDGRLYQMNITLK